jgi:hypothetical protein
MIIYSKPQIRKLRPTREFVPFPAGKEILEVILESIMLEFLRFFKSYLNNEA